jgi:pimeloyl-ACP methyl ester carboxylesterase
MKKLILFISAVFSPMLSADLLEEVTHGYADNNGVKIHYVKTGQGPLVVMIHGFPDYWYTWRHQINALKENFTVVAMDQRGYNLSDQPEGVVAYAMPNLVGDVAAVIKHQGASSASVVGHDWGGAVAWQVAFNLPQMVDNLVILNLPHPSGMARELATNKEQQKNSAYARRFIKGSPTDQDIMFGGPMSAAGLAGWVKDEKDRNHYIEAFKRSSFAGMLNFYKANYPSTDNPSPVADANGTPRLPMPVLIFHGLKDTALHSNGLNNTWDWIDNDVTIVTEPNAGHFVQQDAAQLVSQTMQWWLSTRTP